MEAALIKYPKIERIYKLEELFSGREVVIQEKIDGSNVGIHVGADGEWAVQSRNQMLTAAEPGMFAKVFDWCRVRALSGMFDQLYRHFNETPIILYGEMVGNGKLRYPDAPAFLLFDIYIPCDEVFLRPPFVREVAQAYSIDYLPYAYIGQYQGLEHVKRFLGQSIFNRDVEMEGVVVKTYGDVKCWYTRASDGEVIYYSEPMLAGKLVSEDYQEVKAPHTSLKTATDPLEIIVDSVVTEARIRKAAQRAEEMGKDVRKPHNLIPIVAKDVHDEESDLIKEMLFKAYWKDINRRIAQRVLQEI
jgi:hypothetical protein